jgi:hypothetical protein
MFLKMCSEMNSKWLPRRKKTLIFTGWPETTFPKTQECEVFSVLRLPLCV